MPIPERRTHAAHDLRLDGRRATDPTMTTSDCAERLGVGATFILGEIRDGRLVGHVFTLVGRSRRAYRISPAAFDAYLDRYWTTTSRA